MPLPFISAVVGFLGTTLFAGITVGQALIIAGSAIYQRNQQRRLEGQLAASRDAALGQDIRPTNASEPILIHYGYGETTGIRVFGSTNTDFTNHLLSTTARGQMFGQIDNATGTKNEFAIIQDVIGFEGMNSIIDFEIDEQDAGSDPFTGYHRLNTYLDGGVADPLAFNNHPDIDNTATFDGLSYATGVYRLNREDPQYSGFPTVRYYYEGKRIWDPRDTNQVQSDPSTYTFSNNSVLVLLDYLVNGNYGLGVSLTQIDLPGFITAANIADQVVQSDVTIGGRVFGSDTTRDVRRHEFNGSINSGANHQQNVEEIVNSIPGGILIYTAQGRYKMVVPDSINSAATQSVATLTTRDLINEVSVAYPSTRDKLNQVTITYANASQDFAADTITYPNRTTPALTTQLDAYLVEDNDTQLITAIELPGIGGRYHAANTALAMVAESRLKNYMFNITSQHINLEPGDIVRVVSPQQELDDFVRIQSARVNRNDGTIDVVAVEFDLDTVNNTGTFVWKTEDNETITPREVFDFSIPAPILLQPTLEEGTEVANRVFLQWVDGSNGDAAISEYIIEYRLLSETTFTVAGTTIVGIEQFYHTPVIDGSYVYRVRARARDGRLSPFSNVHNIIYTSTPVTGLVGETVYRFHENAVTDDPGAPTGIDGLGGDWLAESDNPHWEAVAISRRNDSVAEVTDFAITGTAGVQSTSVTDEMQEHTISVSGVSGERVEIPAIPEVTEFTTAGNSANVVGLPALQEQWLIEATGISEGADEFPEEFYIYLTGNTPPVGGTRASNPQIPPNGQSLVVDLDLPATFDFQGDRDFAFLVEETPGGTLGNWLFVNRTIEMAAATNIAEFAAAIDTATLSAVGRFPGATISNVSITATGIRFTITITTTHGLGELRGVARGAGQAFAFIPAGQVALFGVLDAQSSLDIALPLENINENILLTNGLTTDVQLRDSLLASLQANTVITDEFTVSSEMGNVGSLTNVPYVMLVANDNQDHSIGVTFNAEVGGDLTGSEFGAVTGDITSSVSTEIRIDYDSSFTPSFQDIIIGPAINGGEIATTLQSMIDGHGGLTAVQLPNGPTTNEINPGVFDGTLTGTPRNSFNTTGGGTTSWSQTVINTSAVGSQFTVGGYMFLYQGTRPTNSSEGSWGFYRINSFTGTSYNVSRLGSRGVINNDGSFVMSESFSPDIVPIIVSTPGRVQITVDQVGNFAEPTITITENGSTNRLPEFVVSTTREGRLSDTSGGVFTNYIITQAGTQIATGSFGSNQSGTTILNTLRSALTQAGITSVINGGTTLVVTNPVANAEDDIVIAIVAGVNSMGETGNNNLIISRTVVTTSVNAFFAGQDGSVVVRSGTVTLGTINTGGLSTTQIANAIRALYLADANWNVGIVTNSSFSLTSTFVGPDPAPSFTTNVGLRADLFGNETPGTLDVTLTTINDGQNILTIGNLTELTISIGSLTSTVTLPSGANIPQIANALANAIVLNVPDYGANINGATVRAISLITGDRDDITVTVTEVGSNGTVGVVRSLITAGSFGTLDLTNADWTYFVINQEIRVDDDTVDMVTMGGVDNVLQVRRGLINDVQTWDDASSFVGPNPNNAANTEFAYFTESFTSGSRTSQAIFQFSAVSGMNFDFQSVNGVSVFYSLGLSTDGGTTFTTVGLTSAFGFQITSPSTTRTQFRTVLPVSGSMMFNLTPSTEYWLRIGRIFRDDTTNSFILPPAAADANAFVVNSLLIEELTTTT